MSTSPLKNLDDPKGNEPIGFQKDPKTGYSQLVGKIYEKATSPETTEKVKQVVVTENEGYTPLHKACQLNETKATYMVKSLLENKADPNALSKWNETPLLLAVGHEQMVCVKLLLKANPPINVPESKRGNTPLHLACKNGHLGMVELLLKNGADLFAKNKFGQTPTQLAFLNGYIPVGVEIIENYAEEIFFDPSLDASESTLRALEFYCRKDPGMLLVYRDLLLRTPLHLVCEQQERNKFVKNFFHKILDQIKELSSFGIQQFLGIEELHNQTALQFAKENHNKEFKKSINYLFPMGILRTMR